MCVTRDVKYTLPVNPRQTLRQKHKAKKEDLNEPHGPLHIIFVVQKDVTNGSQRLNKKSRACLTPLYIIHAFTMGHFRFV